MAKRRLERSLRVTFLGLLVNAALAAGKVVFKSRRKLHNQKNVMRIKK